eukprot:CAMPEP_0179473036 /NCGR_PEP_ID=MMETSP0799-20121207/52880_1 /TAXON_ID=46947 /ORGANISM="Geminigera cryophila, Strain CCMP2564" /LENGTH=55 /DNA_ID=CAMNT_0021281473 /DNA_START=78 /DNA_END=245 /DNA_ORIENTATION=+
MTRADSHEPTNHEEPKLMHPAASRAVPSTSDTSAAPVPACFAWGSDRVRQGSEGT